AFARAAVEAAEAAAARRSAAARALVVVAAEDGFEDASASRGHDDRGAERGEQNGSKELHGRTPRRRFPRRVWTQLPAFGATAVQSIAFNSTVGRFASRDDALLGRFSRARVRCRAARALRAVALNEQRTALEARIISGHTNDHHPTQPRRGH